MNSNFDKNKVIIVLAIVALLAFLFLPIMDASLGGESASPNGMDYVSGEFEVETPYGVQKYPAELSFDMVVIMAAAVVAGIGGYMKKKKVALVGGVVGFVFLVLNIVNKPDYFETFKNAGGSVSFGLGMWIPLIAFAGVVALAWMLKKEEAQQDAPVEISQQ